MEPGLLAGASVVLVLLWTVAHRLERRQRVRAGPPPRTLETIAHDVVRLGERYHADGVRFAKYEGLRQAYDRVLAEACDALDLPHLFSVLPPGDERDVERCRVEHLLGARGWTVSPA